MVQMAYNVYKAGLLRSDEPWVSGAYRMLLLTGGLVLDPDHSTVAAVLAANTEASDASYARQVLTGKTVIQNDTADRGEASADDVNFGGLDNETPTAAVIFRFNTDDAGSVPMAAFTDGFGAPANGAGYIIEIPTEVAHLL